MASSFLAILCVMAQASGLDKVDFAFTSNSHLDPAARSIVLRGSASEVSGYLRDRLVTMGGKTLTIDESIKRLVVRLPDGSAGCYRRYRSVLEQRWAAFEANSFQKYEGIDLTGLCNEVEFVAAPTGVVVAVDASDIDPRTEKVSYNGKDLESAFASRLVARTWSENGLTYVYLWCGPKSGEVVAGPGNSIGHAWWRVSDGSHEAAIVTRLLGEMRRRFDEAEGETLPRLDGEGAIQASTPPPPRVASAPTPRQAGPQVSAVDDRLVTGKKASRDAAVVIGLEDYPYLTPVPHARRDADSVFQFLVYTRGVPFDRVELLKSASREQIVGAVTDAGRAVAAGGTVWVYFAGHGAASATTGERLVLGDDARPDVRAFDSRGVEVAELTRLAGAGGGQVVVWTDACYTGVGRSGVALVPGARFAVPVEASSRPAQTAEWTAAGANEAALPLESAGHGAFTYYALGALRGWADGEVDGARDGSVTAKEAALFVRRKLNDLPGGSQTPRWSGAPGSGDWVLASGVKETEPNEE